MACTTPYLVRTEMDSGFTPVPCGKCPECLKRRTSGWSFRLELEGQRAVSAHFITMTYDTSTVPITSKGYMDLRKKDLQLFFKRLRKAHPKDHTSLKYYAVGEYGGKSNRPHYHLILFNAQIELISPAWDLGTIHYGQVTGASIGYTLKYMCKPSRIPMHKNDDRQKEFSLMSKGLGSNYFEDEKKKPKRIVQWHKNDLTDRMHLTLLDGKKIAMPRYYKDKIYTEQQRKRIAYFAVIKSNELRDKHERDMFEQYGPNWSKTQVDIDLRKFQKFKIDANRNRDKI